VLLHEVGHIVRCHPAFLHEKYGLAVHEEMPLSRAATEVSRIRLAFEWEADEYAATTSYQVLRAVPPNPMLPLSTELGPDLTWAISVSMTFALVAGLAKGEMLAESESHPPALHRYTWSMTTVESAEETKPFAPDTQTLQRGFDEVAGWFLRNGLPLRVPRAVSRDPTDVINAFAESHSRVRKTLAEEQALLMKLAKARDDGALAWRTSHPSWAASSGLLSV